LGLKKSFPDPVGRRIAQRTGELSKGLGSISIFPGLLKESPQVLGIQKETLDFVGDPDAEGSAAATAATAIGAEDSQCSDGLLLEVVFVVAFEESVSVECADVLAVWTGGAFEQGELLVSLLQ
jgi:hypothetical protein